MRIGCCVSVQNIEKLPECGFDFVELPGKEVFKMERRQVIALRKTLDKRNLTCESLNAYCPADIIIAGPGQNLKEVKAYALRLAEYASELSVRQVGIGAPKSRTLPKGYSREIADCQLQQFLKCTADAFALYGIYTSLEAVGFCYCNYINHLEEAAAVLKAVGHPYLRLVPDFYNMEQSGEAELDLKPYIPMIAHVHISDDDGGPEKRGFLKPEKYGSHERHLTAIKDAGYEGTVSLEVDCPPDSPECIESWRFLKRIADSERREV